MADSLSDADFVASAFAPVNLNAIFAWLALAPASDANDDLAALRSFLTDLRRCRATREQRISALNRLYLRSVPVVDALVASLADVSLPLHRHTRQRIRNLQTLLRTFADDFQTTLEKNDEAALRVNGLPPELIVWRILQVLAQHLLISNLSASPAGVGIWKQLHQSFDHASAIGAGEYAPAGSDTSARQLYHAAILLGCAQPASFTSREVSFVAAYASRFADRIDPAEASASEDSATFWIDPERDAPAHGCARRTAPPEMRVHYFSFSRLAALLESQIAALDVGSNLAGLPAFAETPAGRGVLRRLHVFWGSPGKRLFPRRRQNYRAALCTGLGNLWRMFQDGEATIETSNWMITNESPDGCAIMHVSGKTGNLSVGDITAIRSETGVSWQVCIVRWALSENQEHLELGLQILATRAVPAILALPVAGGDGGQFSVLLLPEVPALRASEMIVVPTGTLAGDPKNLVLVVEQQNLKVREVRRTGIDEQNSQVEVFSIETDALSP
jgi:hypothetical protein